MPAEPVERSRRFSDAARLATLLRASAATEAGRAALSRRACRWAYHFKLLSRLLVRAWLTIQYFTNFAGECFWRKGLLQEAHARLQCPMASDCIISVARHQQHLDIGA